MKSITSISQKRVTKLIKTLKTGERIIPKRVITDEKSNTGICSICDNASTCIYRKDPKKPVLNCEEFQATHSSKITHTAQNTGSRMNTNENDDAINSNVPELKGLCINCDNRQTCIYPKPEGGIWSCEEYA